MSRAPICPIDFTDCDEACPHAWDDGSMAEPTAASVVHKQECAYCFNTNEHHEGIYVCMKCHQGFCGAHVQKHCELTSHALYMRIKATYVPPPKATSVESLGVEMPPEIETSIVCLPCTVQLTDPSCGLLAPVVSGINTALTPQLQDQIATQNANVFAVECKHCPAGVITQVPESERKFAPGRPPATDACCMDPSGCECNVNNWMCLTCGYVGCPRAEAGGKQHAIMHFMMTGHPLVVKLGTVTPLGADVHCYACDDEVKPQELAGLLRGLGVEMASAVKTSKSLSEMMVDQSLKFDYNRITEQGKGLVPAYGPGYTGLKNFGNTCYMASVLQCLSNIPDFQRRYATGPLADHQAGCRVADPHNCHECQLEKLFKGMLSGAFSVDHEKEVDRERLNGCTPRDFKKLFCRGHEDYSTGQQQDAQEFMAWLLGEIARVENGVAGRVGAAGGDVNPGNALEFRQAERTQCSGCGGCRYQEGVSSTLRLPIPLKPYIPPMGPDGQPVSQTDEEKDATRPSCTLDECLSQWLLPNEFECRCDHCGASGVTYSSANRLMTLPDVLAVQALRMYVDHATYQAKKLDCYVDAPDELDVSRLRGNTAAARAHEKVWEVRQLGVPGAGGAAPAAAPAAAAAAPKVEVDEVALATVMSMGIDLDGARWALEQTNNNIERAMEFYFTAPESERPQPGGGGGGSAPAEPAAAAQSAGGQQQDPAAYACRDGDSVYELFGLISHFGHSAHTGHYVAHIKKDDGQWYIFNDEKVARSVDPPKRFASTYLYRRKKSQ